MGEVLAAFSSQPTGGGLRPSASHTSFFDSSGSFGGPRKKSSSFSDLRLAGSGSSSLASSLKSGSNSSRSSFSLAVESDSDDSDDDDDDEGLSFPAYASGTRRQLIIEEDRDTPPSSPVTAAPARPTTTPAENLDPNVSPASPPDLPLHSEDDTAVKVEPTQHVDYLTYQWREEDIWSSWRHIVEHRRVYGERSRLENASWRTWAKNQFSLRTLDPERLSWAKELDISWLYGPLQTASSSKAPGTQNASEPASRLSKSNSFVNNVNKKPILKKRTMSEVMLQKSISTSSLIKQAAAEVQAQQLASGTPLERRRHRPLLNHAQSDFLPSRSISRDPTDYFASSTSSSGLQTPECERKHIRFDEKVEQCIAVDCKGDDDDDYAPDWTKRGDDSSDEDVVMMKRQPRKKRPLSRTSSKSSIHGESKTIAKLEPTTLKYRTDSPDVPENASQGHSLFGFYRSSRLSPSASQETLRPSNPSTNFLLAEDDQDEEQDCWENYGENTGNLEVKRPGTPGLRTSNSQNFPSEDENEPTESGGLRRTASGMFMPIEDEEEDPAPPGIIGSIVDTVNTARDIVHVIVNAGGWRNPNPNY